MTEINNYCGKGVAFWWKIKEIKGYNIIVKLKQCEYLYDEM